jgi:putative redox protein
MAEHTPDTAAPPTTSLATPPVGKPPSRVTLEWEGPGTLAFAGGKTAGGPRVVVDNKGKAGPGPVDTLLIALAACTSEDVLNVLEKRRTPASSFRIEVVGDRLNAVPARLERIHLRYIVDGEGIDRANAMRAIELAVTKYCSVRDSLDKSIEVGWSLVLNGAE